MSISEISSSQPKIQEAPKEVVERFLGAFNQKILESNYSEQTFESALNACKNKQWQELKGMEKEMGELSVLWDNTLLNYAISQKEDEWANQLIKYQIDIYSTDGVGNTPLHIAAQTGACHLIKALPDLLEIKNKEGKTPLHIAIESGNSKFVEELLKKKANPQQTISMGGNLKLNALGLCIMKGQNECIDYLMKECDYKMRFSTIGNLLHLTIEFHQVDTLQYLIATYPNFKELIEDRNPAGLTPLSFAASIGNHEAIGILYHYKASIEAKDLDQRTPLHHAALGGHYETLQLLSVLGAKINAEDNDNKRPIDLITNNVRCKSLMRSLHHQKTRPIAKPLSAKNLVLRGGGPKGVAYLGALEILQDEQLLEGLERIAGTSAGAITAAFIAINLPIDQLRKLLKETNLMDFLDHPLSSQKLETAFKGATKDFTSVLKTLYQTLQTCISIAKNPSKLITAPFQALYKCTGICEGEIMRKWLEETIEKQTGKPFFTLGDLADAIKKGKPYKHIHIYGTRVGTHPEITHISSEDPSWSDIILSDAIRISMSIPGVFKPHIVHIRNQGKRIPAPQLGSYLDGGILYNFPIETFDRKQFLSRENLGEEGNCPKYNKETLGLSLYSSLEKKPVELSNVLTIKDLLTGIANVYLNAEESIRQLNPYNASRVIEIDVKDVGTLSFNMSEETKNTLVDSGRQKTRSFLEQSSFVKIPRLTLVTADEIAFGSSIWEKHWGPIGKNIPSIPKNMNKFLRSPCIVWPDKKRYETHILALVPKITFQEFHKKFPLFTLDDPVESNSDHFYWILMLRSNIPNCIKMTYQERCARLSQYEGYSPPKLIEIAICATFELLENKQTLYSEKSLSWQRWTQCEETLGGDQIAFGNADEETMRIFPYPGKSFGGISGVIRFEEK